MTQFTISALSNLKISTVTWFHFCFRGMYTTGTHTDRITQVYIAKLNCFWGG